MSSIKKERERERERERDRQTDRQRDSPIRASPINELALQKNYDNQYKERTTKI